MFHQQNKSEKHKINLSSYYNGLNEKRGHNDKAKLDRTTRKDTFQLVTQDPINVIYNIGANKGDWSKQYTAKLPELSSICLKQCPAQSHQKGKAIGTISLLATIN